MNRIARLGRSVLFRNFRNLNEVAYFRTILLKSQCICMTTNNFAYFSGNIIFNPSRTRKLCVVPALSCWKCNYTYSASVDGEAVFFCPSCSVVQEPIPERTHFDMMNCKQAFDLDTNILTKTFRMLQSHLHPDKFSLKSEMEQNLSSLQSSLVNEAYQILIKPLSRGLYLLELKGMAIEEGSVGREVEFLSEIMEMNETLEDGSNETLKKMRSQIEEKIEFCIQRASDTFEKQDLSAAKEILSKMKYYDNISEQIREKLLE